MHRVSFYPSESEPGLKRFLEDMGRYPVLDSREQAFLLARAKEGSEEAARRVCRHNLRFVYLVALRYRNAGMPLLDVINEGAMGLMKAVPRFDPTKKVKFISYAVWWIRQGILNAIKERSRLVRLSTHHEVDIRKVRFAALRQIIGGAYTLDLDKIPGLTTLTPEYLEANQGAGTAPLSLDSPIGEEGDTHQAFLVSEDPLQDEDVYSKERIEILKRLIGKLTTQERQVVRLRYGLGGGEPMVLGDVAEIMGLTRERVRQIQNEALEWMRDRGRKYRGD